MAVKKSKRIAWADTLLFIFKIFGIFLSVILALFFIVALILPRPFYKEGFKTLKEIEMYAMSTSELTPLESDNAVKPDFTNYYNRFSPSIKNTIFAKISGLLQTLRLKSQPIFSASFFKTLIEDVNSFREQAGFKNKNIVKITAKPTSKFVLIGDLQAAFHSLVRDCLKLKELGIIDDNLKIIPQDCFIIFLGNVPSRSPFSMEILSLVLRLMQQNPERVLYTKGSHETDRYWEEHTLKTEIKVRSAYFMQDASPLINNVNKFFESLPSLIYLSAPAQDKNAFIRIGLALKEKLDDKHFGKFLMTDQKKDISILSWEESNRPVASPDVPQINVKAIMRVEKKRETYQPSEGLRTLTPEMGVTTWTLLSGPTLAVEKGFKFYNDTFALIESADHIDQWKITLHYQDRREKKGYKTQVLYMTSGRDVPVATQQSSNQSTQQAQQVQPQKAQVTQQVVQPTQQQQVQQTQQAQQQPQSISPQAQPQPQAAQTIQNSQQVSQVERLKSLEPQPQAQAQKSQATQQVQPPQQGQPTQSQQIQQVSQPQQVIINNQANQVQPPQQTLPVQQVVPAIQSSQQTSVPLPQAQSGVK